MGRLRQLAYWWIEGIARHTGLGGVWARAAIWYVWDRPAIDPGAGKRLFQVVGVPRSGTTLLANLITAHPDVYCMIEPYRGFYIRGYSTDRGQTDNCHPNRFVSRVLRERPEPCVGLKETFLSRTYPHHRNERFFDRLAESGAITIAILRDPRDAYASAVASFETGGFMSGTDASAFASNWQRFVQWSSEHADISVTYESLVLEPEQTMSAVLRLLGLELTDYRPVPRPITDSVEELGDPAGLVSRSINRSSIGRYTTVLLPDAVSAIERQCGQEMAALNYL